MPDIVITEFMDEAAITEGLAGWDVHYDPDLVDKPQDLLRLVADARALIVRNRTEVRGELLKAAVSLKAVGRLGVGLDNIDLDACKARDIKVLPASGANDLAVAEYAVTAALMLIRGAYLATPQMVAGRWPRNALIGGEISGKCLGLIGFGAIAKLTAKLAQGLGMRVVAYDAYAVTAAYVEAQVTQLSLEELLARADVVSLHVPLTDATKNMIDAATLARMKPSAVLINAARGGVVDEAALVAALRAKTIAGAALDVFASEPLKGASADNFKDVPGLILTPHIAGVTVESNTRVSWVTVDNVKKALSV